MCLNKVKRLLQVYAFLQPAVSRTSSARMFKVAATEVAWPWPRNDVSETQLLLIQSGNSAFAKNPLQQIFQMLINLN